MKPFSKKHMCPKCGRDDITETFCTGNFGERLPWGCDGHEKERIHRHCGGCHYEWDESPLDAKKTRDPTTGADTGPVRACR